MGNFIQRLQKQADGISLNKVTRRFFDYYDIKPQENYKRRYILK